MIFKQITNQSKRYTYTTDNFQASNKSIRTLHLHNLLFLSFKITIRSLHLHNLFSGVKITSTTPT